MPELFIGLAVLEERQVRQKDELVDQLWDQARVRNQIQEFKESNLKLPFHFDSPPNHEILGYEVLQEHCELLRERTLRRRRAILSHELQQVELVGLLCNHLEDQLHLMLLSELNFAHEIHKFAERDDMVQFTAAKVIKNQVRHSLIFFSSVPMRQAAMKACLCSAQRYQRHVLIVIFAEGAEESLVHLKIELLL